MPPPPTWGCISFIPIWQKPIPELPQLICLICYQCQPETAGDNPTSRRIPSSRNQWFKWVLHSPAGGSSIKASATSNPQRFTPPLFLPASLPREAGPPPQYPTESVRPPSPCWSPSTTEELPRFLLSSHSFRPLSMDGLMLFFSSRFDTISLSLLGHMHLAFPAAHWVIVNGNLYHLRKNKFADPVFCSYCPPSPPPPPISYLSSSREDWLSQGRHCFYTTPSSLRSCLPSSSPIPYRAALLKAPLIPTWCLILILLDMIASLDPVDLTFPFEYLLPLMLVLFCSQLLHLARPFSQSASVKSLNALPWLSFFLWFCSGWCLLRPPFS